MKITNAQIKKIHALKNALKLEDDLYREMLLPFNAASSKDLTDYLAEIFIYQLESMAVKMGVWENPSLKYEDLRYREEKMASPQQLRMIEAMWRDVCYFDNDKFAKKSLRKFMRNKYKVDDLMFLTKAKATKVIQGIKGIKKQLERHAKETSAGST